MKKIVYFYYPTESGGVIFQNGYLDESLRNNRNLRDIGIDRYNLSSEGRPEIASTTLFLQGRARNRDLDFETRKSKPRQFEAVLELINKINNGDINV